MKYSIIIPAYNEGAAIQTALDGVLEYFRVLAPGEFEIIVVDDGSRDNTAKMVGDLFFQTPEVRLLKNEINSGKGYSVRRGMLSAVGEYAIFLDADLSTPVEEFDKFKNYLADYDILIGSRAIPGAKIKKYQSWLRVFLGRVGNIFIRLVLGLKIYDTQCGFKVFNKRARKLFEMQRLNRWSFDAEILFLAVRVGLKIKEIPIDWTNDETSTVRFADYFRTIGDVIKIRLDYWRGKYFNL